MNTSQHPLNVRYRSRVKGLSGAEVIDRLLADAMRSEARSDVAVLAGGLFTVDEARIVALEYGWEIQLCDVRTLQVCGTVYADGSFRLVYPEVISGEALVS